MLNYLVGKYAVLYARNFELKKGIFAIMANLISKMIRLLVIRILEHNSRNPEFSLSNRKEIIVSLTTFPARVHSLRYTLLSIFRQSRLPDRIIVNLIKNEWPNGLDDLPKELIEFSKKGVHFCIRDENLKPHNKYYYSFKDFPNSIIITIDDDYYYKSDLIENLLNLHEKYPNAVCANLVKKITLKDGSFLPYKEWKIMNENVIGNDFLALGFGGVLYPVYLFANSGVLNRDIFKQLSLATDDLWLKAIEILTDIPVASGRFNSFPLSLETGRIEALSSINVGQNRNDFNWSNLNKYFSLSVKLINKV